MPPLSLPFFPDLCVFQCASLSVCAHYGGWRAVLKSQRKDKTVCSTLTEKTQWAEETNLTWHYRICSLPDIFHALASLSKKKTRQVVSNPKQSLLCSAYSLDLQLYDSASLIASELVWCRGIQWAILPENPSRDSFHIQVWLRTSQLFMWQPRQSAEHLH